MTNAELIAEIRKLATELGTPETLPGLTKLRKPALEQLRDGLRLNLQAREEDRDESVNEAVDGADVMTRWLALPADKQEQTAQWHRDNLAATPSPLRAYQSAMEGLAVLEAHLIGTYACAACSSPVLVTNQPNHVDSGECEQFQREAGYHKDGCEWTPSDTEATIADVEANVPLVDQKIYPFDMTMSKLITETDVRTPSGKALVALVQFGSKLVWGRLIAVVNRRTPPRGLDGALLATVEIGGVRKLVTASDILVGDALVVA